MKAFISLSDIQPLSEEEEAVMKLKGKRYSVLNEEGNETMVFYFYNNRILLADIEKEK